MEGEDVETAPRSGRNVPAWLLYTDLACAVLAGAFWYLFSAAGPWPLLLVLAPWALRWVITGRPAQRTPFDVPLLLFLVTAALSVWAAFDRPAAWAKFWLIVGGVALFYAFHHAAPLARRRVWLLSVFGAMVAVYFLATNDWVAYPAKIAAVTSLGQVLQARLPPLNLHRLHPNVAGGILAMMVPFAGVATLLARRDLRALLGRHGGLHLLSPNRTRRLAQPWLAIGLALACLFLILFGLLMSTSRGAWIALGCALLLAALWGLSNRTSHSQPALRPWLFPGLVALFLVLALATAAAWPGGIIAALSTLPGPNTGIARVELLRNSLTLVRDYPLIGAGLGSFQMLYSTYALFLHVGFAIHSHNLLINVAIEQGGPAVLLILWMWALMAAMVGLGWTRRSAGAQTWAAESMAAAALCLIVVLVHGLVDDVLYGSRAVLLLFLPLAFGFWPEAGSTRSWPGQWARRWELVLPAGLAVILILALVWRRPLLSVVYSNLGAVHQSQAELSVYSWPKWPLQDEVRRTIDLSRPIAEFERALVLNPHNATANRRLGMVDLSLGRYDQALVHLEAAYAAEPGSEATRKLLGEAYLANGQLAQGKALWATVGNQAGELAARVFWYGYIGDKERQAWMKQAAEGR
jgi:O-antigen ligase